MRKRLITISVFSMLEAEEVFPTCGLAVHVNYFPDFIGCVFKCQVFIGLKHKVYKLFTNDLASHSIWVLEVFTTSSGKQKYLDA